MGRNPRGFRPRAALCAALLSTLTLANVSHAAWSHDPAVNLPVCTAPFSQTVPVSVSDGAGGAIVGWMDQRNEAAIIYAHHVLSSGTVDGAWPVNGRRLTTLLLTSQFSPAIASDGAGGAILTWNDQRVGSGTNNDIYAQHVLASGAVDPAWPADARALCTSIGTQNTPTIVSDGAGGAIVTWQDQRSGSYDIYAQHVLASGAVDGAWPVDGLAVCTAINPQMQPTIASDGAGGAIITWYDLRNGNNDIYAQHVLASGTVDGAWPADGRALCTAANSQASVRIVADGAGGAIVGWADQRNDAGDVYAQHILSSGVVDGAWPADGQALCTAAQSQTFRVIVSDGAGGAIVAWEDNRNGLSDIYAQHVLASGAVDGAWPADGRALCTAADSQSQPQIASDGAGGAIVDWIDSRNGSSRELYAQHVLSTGAVDATWPVDGRVLCTAAGTRFGPTIVADGRGGAIAAWGDAGRTFNAIDIYAQRVGPSGFIGDPEPKITSVIDVPDDNGGAVTLSWTASYLDTETPYQADHYSIYRRAPSSWVYAGTEPATHAATYEHVAATASDSIAAGPRSVFLVIASNADSTVWVPSEPDSGYSVDDLAPATPAPFVAGYTTSATYLHWGANPDPDLASYHLHRGDASGFVPGPGNLLATQADTGFVDTTSTWSYYKLSAVDVHGHESGFALLVPGSQATGGTPPGDSVQVSVGPNVGLMFQNVTGGGQTQVTVQTNGTAPPSGFKLAPTSPTKYYVITTTATFDGWVTICISYSDAEVSGNETHLKLNVYDPPSGKWVNITTTRDVNANIICGRTTHFSEFALMEPISPLAVEDAPLAGVRFYPCSPNPTTRATAIRFALPREGPVTLGIYDTGGRRVRDLGRGVLPAGEKTRLWDGRDDAGRAVRGGLYLVRLEAEGRTFVQKVVTR